MNWSYRASTNAAQKLPVDWEEEAMDMLFRSAILIQEEDIHESQCGNLDQTQMNLIMGGDKTWNEKGASQVSVVGKEEKRAVTILVGVTMDGTALPFQVIFKGKTTASCPSPNSPCYDESIELGFKYEPSKTDTYWSNQETMLKYYREILVPHFLERKKFHGLPADARAIDFRDVWSVHRSDELITALEAEFPWLHTIFVPGGLTGKMQPCDVGIQRPLKLDLKRSCLADMVDETRQYLKSGIDSKNIVLDKTIGTLRDRIPAWLISAHKRINDPALIRKVRLVQIQLQ